MVGTLPIFLQKLKCIPSKLLTMSANQTNMGLPDNIMYVMMAGMLPLFMTTVMTAMTACAPDLIKLIKSVYNYFRNYGWNVVTIKIYSTKSSSIITGTYWVVDPEHTNNKRIFDAVTEYINKRGKFSTNTTCDLGDGLRNLMDDNLQFNKSRHIHMAPGAAMTIDGFIINYASIYVNDKDTTRHERILTISSRKPSMQIREFIMMAYDEYCIANYSDKIEPHLYRQVPSAVGVRFKKYPINNTTSFDTLHFPEKEKVIQLVKNLNDGNLKKLSILLHGMPGCGK